MAFKFTLVSSLILIARALLPGAAAQCSTAQPEHLCCQEFIPFSENAAVFEGVCGNPAPSDLSVMVGTLCEPVTGSECAPPVFNDFFDLCCASILPCPSGSVDGPIGFNCTGHQVE
ncbi:hypothetical protein OBBRIDRAFT_790978 [Obba rivulosa]|uniref:Uncharacterized protein n=1 Tax=Obba rivulosa TaxID=1052685 RepID=A0A8E2B503_9APHY|nr:hypothetical protein OBBRIDRAFT_790978 [Obba rivulosa]